MKIHPKDLALEEFFLALGEHQQAFLSHLLQCNGCRRRLHAVLGRISAEDAGEAEEESGWAPVGVDLEVGEGPADPLAVQAQNLLEEREVAPGLFVELMGLSADRQLLLIRNSPRFRTWGLCELLLERCGDAAVENPRDAAQMSLLALEIAAQLSKTHPDPRLVEDLRARAWTCLGNARRVMSDFLGAEEAFRKAEESLLRGSKDPLERAFFLDRLASLRRDQREFTEALSLLRRSVAIFRRMGDSHSAGRSLVKMDTVYRYAGRPEKGAALLSQGIELIDADREPRLALCGHHNLIDYLADTGRFREAQKLYGEIRPLYHSFPDAVTQARRQWIKAKISVGLGRPKQAERLLLKARTTFIAEEMAYDSALVSLELALLYARGGRDADLKQLAEEMLAIFASLHVHREALAALRFLQRALDAEQVSLEVVTQVARFLRRAEHDPGLRFEP